jgi:hypothetical protein
MSWWFQLVALASATDRTDVTETDGTSEILGGFAVGDLPAPIINGDPAEADLWPMTGGLLISADVGFSGAEISSKLLMCTSTLIAPDVVLTAAHCVDLDALLETSGYGEMITLSNVEFGWSNEPDLSAFTALSFVDVEWPTGTRTGVDAVAHPDFSLTGLQIGLAENFDVALVFLDEPVLDVAHAWLPTAEEAEQILPGAPVEIVGWGQQTSDTTPPAGTVGKKFFASSVVGEVSDYEIQIGDSPDDGRKCHGDSGGPTYFEVDSDAGPDRWRVIGVTSHAFDFSDCESEGGVDTRVDYYLEWIEEEMTSRCEAGTRSWCEQPGIPKQRTAVAGNALTDDEKGGCSTAPAVPGALVSALALLLVRRRR